MLSGSEFIAGAGPGSLVLLLLLALLIDAAIGGLGQGQERGFGPRAWLGVAITQAARRGNRPGLSRAALERRGALAAVAVVALAAGVGQALDLAIQSYPYTGQVVALVLLVLVLDQRAALDRARAFARALRGGDTAPARTAGEAIDRRPATRDVYAIARVAIETMARALTRGVVAPAFWFLLFGLAGVLGYTAVGELDRRLGEVSGATRAFGRFAARLDDAATFIPARLAGVFLLLAALVTPTADPVAAGRTISQAGAAGASLNMRWSLGPVAGALGLALAGPYRRADGGYVHAPWIGSGRARAQVRDIKRAMVLLGVAAVLHLAALIGLFAGLAAS